MNSLFDVVLWGAPALLLSWGLLLAVACVVVFHEAPLRRKQRGHSGVAGAGA